jgi:hypothetical protein
MTLSKKLSEFNKAYNNQENKEAVYLYEDSRKYYDKIAAVGVEIYDCTPAQLMATKTQAQLDSYTVFSTKDLAGTYTYSGTDGYPIVEGYSLVMCDGTPYYQKIEYSPCL